MAEKKRVPEVDDLRRGYVVRARDNALRHVSKGPLICCASDLVLLWQSVLSSLGEYMQATKPRASKGYVEMQCLDDIANDCTACDACLG